MGVERTRQLSVIEMFVSMSCVDRTFACFHLGGVRSANISSFARSYSSV